MSEQVAKVAHFFDDIANQYAQKYGKSNVLTEYFFQQRLQAAIEDIDIANKKILDIGAGTGPLFDVFKTQQLPFEYFACDISPNMREKSNIPSDQYHIGQAFEINWGNSTFDYIFVLGVTTYMTKTDWEKTLDFIHQRLSPNGKAIISFTNEQSFDIKIRRFFNHFKFILNQKNVISQSFEIQTFDYQIFIQNASNTFTVTKTSWLNQTLSGLNRIAPKMSIKVGQFLLQKFKHNTAVIEKCSSDFLLILKKHDN
jgi:2-polyprenyl-3-methyl-5-hydroxy-6-metoxy-1,4-benzoquinol methylase